MSQSPSAGSFANKTPILEIGSFFAPWGSSSLSQARYHDFSFLCVVVQCQLGSVGLWHLGRVICHCPGQLYFREIVQGPGRQLGLLTRALGAQPV